MQKNIYISVVAAAAVLVVDLILFHGNEGVMTAVGVATFFGSLGLFVVLDQREYGARYSQRRNSD